MSGARLPATTTVEPTAVSFRALGTSATVLVNTDDEACLEVAVEAVKAQVTAMDAAASRFRDDSELVGLNRSAGRPRRVSPVLLEAVDAALRAARLTGGLV